MDIQPETIRYLKENESSLGIELSSSPDAKTDRKKVSEIFKLSSLGRLYGRNRKERRENAKKRARSE